MAFFRRNKSGVTRIVRDTYNNKSTTGRSWWDWCALVRRRAGNRCEDCHKPENPRAGVHHEVHHIIPLSRGGITALWNLILLCKVCHDRRHKHLAGRKH